GPSRISFRMKFPRADCPRWRRPCPQPSLLFPFLVLFTAMSPTSSRAQRPDYPEARRAGVAEKLHGVEGADPYRWMEDVDSEETRAWIAAQNGLAEEYFSETPGRDWIRRKLT